MQNVSTPYSKTGNLPPGKLSRWLTMLVMLLAGSAYQASAQAPYCTATYSSGCSSNDKIVNVTIGSINNNTDPNSGCASAYTFFSSQSTTIIGGLAYSISITSGYSGSENVGFFIDWNADNDFNDPGEFITGGVVGSYGTVTYNFTAPLTLAAGPSRLRVQMIWSSPAVSAATPCGSYSFGEIEDYAVTLVQPTPCAGMPFSANVAPAGPVISTCLGSNLTFNANGSTLGLNLTYIWQDSVAGSAGWNTLSSGGQIGPLAVTVSVDSTYYRHIVQCTNSSLSDTSNNMVLVVTPKPYYVPIPYVQNFESWMNFCNTTDKPDTSWVMSFPSGDRSWRRNDQGASASWSNATGGAYTPASTQGSYSARYHSYQPQTGNSIGSMMLHVNTLGGPAGDKALAYDVINLAGGTGLDSLKVYLSVDSGANFAQIDGIGITPGWVPRLLNIPANSRKTIIKFEGKGAFGNNTDIGVDNVRVLPACSGMPTAGTISPAGPVNTRTGR